MSKEKIEILDEKSKECAQELIEALEHGDVATARSLINQLEDVRRESLYHELGVFTRELHEQLKAVGIKGVTEHIPDTKVRLQRVVEIMEAAATKTIEQLEETMPFPKEMSQDAKQLLANWEKFERKEMSSGEFKDFYDTMMAFLKGCEENAVTTQTRLQEVLVTQDFQDLTGQSILKVMASVTELEEKLVAMLKITAELLDSKGLETPEQEAKPVVSEKSQEVSGQDEVDDLLSDLGF